MVHVGSTVLPQDRTTERRPVRLLKTSTTLRGAVARLARGTFSGADHFRARRSGVVPHRPNCFWARMGGKK